MRILSFEFVTWPQSRVKPMEGLRTGQSCYCQPAPGRLRLSLFLQKRDRYVICLFWLVLDSQRWLWLRVNHLSKRSIRARKRLSSSGQNKSRSLPQESSGAPVLLCQGCERFLSFCFFLNHIKKSNVARPSVVCVCECITFAGLAVRLKSESDRTAAAHPC